MEQLDYDFFRAEKDTAMSAGVIARTILLDKMVSQFVKENPKGTVAKHMKEKSIEATRAKFIWGLKSGKELETLAPGFIWVRDVSLTEGMKVIPCETSDGCTVAET